MTPRTAREIQIRNEAYEQGKDEAYNWCADRIKEIKGTLSRHRGSQIVGTVDDTRNLLAEIERKFRG